MTTITMTPKLQITQPPAGPIAKRSLSATLYAKFLRWIDDSSKEAITKAALRLAGVLLIAALIFAPSFATGYLTAFLKWNSYRIPIFFSVLSVMLNARGILRLARRSALSLKRGNQHTYRGFAVSELADFLTSTGGLKLEDARGRLAMTHGQWAKMADELEKRGVLTRGESNARVLRPITREQLVRQLRDGFPLTWDEERQGWFERDGAFARWTLDREWKRRKIDQATDRAEAKLGRLQKRAGAFQSIMGAREGIPAL